MFFCIVDETLVVVKFWEFSYFCVASIKFLDLIVCAGETAGKRCVVL